MSHKPTYPAHNQFIVGIRGILPSVDYLFMLGELLNVHMEDFLVKKNAVPMIYDIGQCYSQATQKRFMAYYHDNRNLPGNLMLLYEQLIRIV